MSSDMHLMARLLAAVKAGEVSRPFDVSLVDPAVLRCTAEERDRMALKLSKEGYVDGLFVIDGIDNAPTPLVRWDISEPELTLAGMAFIEQNEPLRKAMAEIRSLAVAVAAQTVTNTITQMLGQ